MWFTWLTGKELKYKKSNSETTKKDYRQREHSHCQIVGYEEKSPILIVITTLGTWWIQEAQLWMIWTRTPASTMTTETKLSFGQARPWMNLSETDDRDRNNKRRKSKICKVVLCKFSDFLWGGDGELKGNVFRKLNLNQRCL